MFEQAVRQIPEIPVMASLPVYVRSIGKKDFQNTEENRLPPFLTKFIGLTFCLSGSGTAYLFDRALPVKPNDVIIYYSGEEHRYIPSSPDNVIAWINFDGPLAMSVFSCYNLPRRINLKNGFPEYIYNELLYCLPKSDADSILHSSTLLFLLFEYLAREGGNFAASSGYSIERVVHYIETNLSNPDLNVNLLCDMMHLSRSAFRKKFSMEMRCSPGEYIRYKRIAKARTLLAGTDLPISEIGRQCGFPEKSSFSRFFKSVPNSMAPNLYRKKYRGQNIHLSGNENE